jgi:hypothetical protein
MNPAPSSPGPRVAVITPYYQENQETLRHCVQSVADQTYPCTHFLVADGSPLFETVRQWPGAEHLLLGHPHADVGNTPRCIGSLSAMNQGYDAVAYLDADNWYYPGHIAAMVELQRQSGAAVCTATRTIHRADGSLMGTDTNESNGEKFCDTSCLYLTRQAFGLLPIWAMMPKPLGVSGDRIMWTAIINQGFQRARHSVPTVAFRTRYAIHYQTIGEAPPPDAKSNAEHTGRINQWWKDLPEAERTKWLRYFGTRLI